MLRFRSLLVAVLVLGVCGVALAQTKAKHAKPRKHKFTLSAQLSVLKHSANYPARHSTLVAAGTEAGTPGTDGTIVQRETITGQKARTYTFKGTGTEFFKSSMITSTLTGTATVDATGGISVKGHGKYVSGTGAFMRLRGTFTFSGSSPASSQCKSQVLNLKSTGTVWLQR